MAYPTPEKATILLTYLILLEKIWYSDEVKEMSDFGKKWEFAEIKI